MLEFCFERTRLQADVHTHTHTLALPRNIDFEWCLVQTHSSLKS